MGGDDTALIEVVRNGTPEEVRQALAAQHDLAARDDHGWAPLDWAAGRGDAAIVQALLDAGADPLATGDGQRTPYQIALAAGHREAALLLRQAEDGRNLDGPADRTWRPYCRAYPLAELRRFPGWPADTPADAPADTPADAPADTAATTEASEDEVQIVFLHDDLTVTRSMWPGEDVLFDSMTEEWARYCAEELQFRVPDELDLTAEGQVDVGQDGSAR